MMLLTTLTSTLLAKVNPRAKHGHEVHSRQVLELWKQTAMLSISKPIINEVKLFSRTPNLEKDKAQLSDWYILQTV